MAVPDRSDTGPARHERDQGSALESQVDFENLQWLLARDDAEMPRREPTAEATLEHSTRPLYWCRGEQSDCMFVPMG